MSSLAWIALSIVTISHTSVEGTRWRQAVELAMNDEEIGKLTVISRSRTEPASAYGASAALDDRPRPGREPTVTPKAKAWLVSLAATKPRSTPIRTSCGQPGAWRAVHIKLLDPEILAHPSHRGGAHA
jgi:hypothetical protein